jgi:hypothetical protein
MSSFKTYFHNSMLSLKHLGLKPSVNKGCNYKNFNKIFFIDKMLGFTDVFSYLS